MGYRKLVSGFGVPRYTDSWCSLSVLPEKHKPCAFCLRPPLGPLSPSHLWGLWGSHGCSSPASPNSTTWFKPASPRGLGLSPSHPHFLPSRMLPSVVPGPGGHSHPWALSAVPPGSLAADLPQPPKWQRLSPVSPAPHSAATAAAAAATSPTPPSQPAAAAAWSSSWGPEGVTPDRRCPHGTSQRLPACHLLTHRSISHGQQRPSPAFCSRRPPGAQRAHRGAAPACARSLRLLHLLRRGCSAQAFLLGLRPYLPCFCLSLLLPGWHFGPVLTPYTFWSLSRGCSSHLLGLCLNYWGP